MEIGWPLPEVLLNLGREGFAGTAPARPLYRQRDGHHKPSGSRRRSPCGPFGRRTFVVLGPCRGRAPLDHGQHPSSTAAPGPAGSRLLWQPSSSNVLHLGSSPPPLSGSDVREIKNEQKPQSMCLADQVRQAQLYGRLSEHCRNHRQAGSRTCYARHSTPSFAGAGTMAGWRGRRPDPPPPADDRGRRDWGQPGTCGSTSRVGAPPRLSAPNVRPPRPGGQAPTFGVTGLAARPMSPSSGTTPHRPAADGSRTIRPQAGAGSVVQRCGRGWSAVADAPSAPPSRRNHPVIPGPSPTRFTVFADDSRALLRLLGLRPFAFSLTDVWI